MALIKCPECANEISEEAFKCPKCGKKLKTPQRSTFGKVIKYVFIGFNLLMTWWFVGGMGKATEGMGQLKGAEHAGAAVGTAIGAGIILFIWVVGVVILGLFTFLTRPKE